MVSIDNSIIFDQFPILDKFSREVIIGANTLQSWEIILDARNESITVGVDLNAMELLCNVKGNKVEMAGINVQCPHVSNSYHMRKKS